MFTNQVETTWFGWLDPFFNNKAFDICFQFDSLAGRVYYFKIHGSCLQLVRWFGLSGFPSKIPGFKEPKTIR